MDASHHVFKSAKLLICLVDRHRGDHLMKISKSAGARGGTIAPGRGLIDNCVLRFLSLDDYDQDVVFTILGPERATVISTLTRAALKDKKLAGQAIVLDVSGLLCRLTCQGEDNGQPQTAQNSTGEIMSEYKLISVIVNHGYADDVMEVARAAGAKGGTILTARGTGTEEDVKFFGITLVPEKEILMIVAKTETVPAILEAISQVEDICQPGGGIVYNMNIEQFIVLGQTNPDA